MYFGLHNHHPDFWKNSSLLLTISPIRRKNKRTNKQKQKQKRNPLFKFEYCFNIFPQFLSLQVCTSSTQESPIYGVLDFILIYKSLNKYTYTRKIWNFKYTVSIPPPNSIVPDWTQMKANFSSIKRVTLLYKFRQPLRIVVFLICELV